MSRPEDVSLAAYGAARRRSDLEANRLLFSWLSDDACRARLYQLLREDKIVLGLPSRADTKDQVTDDSCFRQEVYLLSARSHVAAAILDPQAFSSSPYRALGSGTFMLGLDDAGDHDAQRQFAEAYLDELKPPVATALAQAAWWEAAVLPLKRREFDLAELAEQFALRYVGLRFGFAQADHVLLEQTMRKTYQGLTYQMLGRHFVSEPLDVPTATGAMGTLLTRVAELIDLYGAPIGARQEDALEALDAELEALRKFTIQNRKDPAENAKPLADFRPILRRIAHPDLQGLERKFSASELAVMVVGMIAGTIGNIQACACIAIQAFFATADRFQRACDAAKKAREADAGGRASDESDLRALIWEALRLNPPAPFLPRKTTRDYDFKEGTDASIPADRLVILAIGGATRDVADRPDDFVPERGPGDPLIFGAPGREGAMHDCIGSGLAMVAVTRIVKEVLLLPGLAQSLDPRTARPVGLEKLWGFMCRSYPLEFKRDSLLKQSPLIVVMKVKSPVPEHAEALRLIIQYGAPMIEKKLNEARHVHFAEFLFVENDSKLVLFTVYDRDFDSYIEHFALQVGPLFDLLFEHIEDAPPRPVGRFPKEFVDTIRRYNARPVSDYLFSAYPRVDVSMIVQEFTRKNT